MGGISTREGSEMSRSLKIFRMNPKASLPAINMARGTAAVKRFDIQASFAASFREWRLKNDLTLKEVAMDLGISISTVNCWELGQRFPSGRHLELLVDYTGLPPCKFFCIKIEACVPPECELAPAAISPIQTAKQPAISTLSRI